MGRHWNDSLGPSSAAECVDSLSLTTAFAKKFAQHLHYVMSSPEAPIDEDIRDSIAAQLGALLELYRGGQNELTW